MRRMMSWLNGWLEGLENVHTPPPGPLAGAYLHGRWARQRWNIRAARWRRRLGGGPVRRPLRDGGKGLRRY